MTGPNVFSLPPEYLALAAFEDEDNELAPRSLLDDPAMARDYLEEMRGVVGAMSPGAEIEAFALRIAKAGKMLQGEIDALGDWLADVQRRKRMRELRLEILKSYLVSLMASYDVQRVKDPQLSLWTAGNPPSCNVFDEAAVPDAYVRVTLDIPRAEVPEGFEKDIVATKVDRAGIIANTKETGEIPPGVDIVTDRRHVVWR